MLFVASAPRLFAYARPGFRKCYPSRMNNWTLIIAKVFHDMMIVIDRGNAGFLTILAKSYLNSSNPFSSYETPPLSPLSG